MRNGNIVVRVMLALVLSGFVPVANAAGEKGGPFVNLTTDDTRAAAKANLFRAREGLERGPRTGSHLDERSRDLPH